MTKCGTKPAWAECLRLIKLDVCEAIAADELYGLFEEHLNAQPDIQPPSVGTAFVVEAIMRRMALALERLLQSEGSERANFSRLRKLVASELLVDKPRLNAAFANADVIRQSSVRQRLTAARNGFMAHTLVGSFGARAGLDAGEALELVSCLSDVERIVEELHVALTGTPAGLDEVREKWRREAEAFWRSSWPT